MSNYKAETTLNERDSLLDMLQLEKEMVKAYATCLTEGVSKGFRTAVKKCLDMQIGTQFDTFMLLTELDYARVTSSCEKDCIDQKNNFEKIKGQLS